MCNLFRACLYFEEDILNQKEAGQLKHYFFLNVRSDRYCFINMEILYNIKARVKLATEPTQSIHAYLVSSV